MELVSEVAGHDHEFLRHAAADDAGAADPMLLGDGHALAAKRGQARRPDAARAGADDEQVVVVGLSHSAFPGRFVVAGSHPLPHRQVARAGLAGAARIRRRPGVSSEPRFVAGTSIRADSR